MNIITDPCRHIIRFSLYSLVLVLCFSKGETSEDKEEFIDSVSKLYVDGMRRHNPEQDELYWGGNLEIEMAAQHLKKQIWIHEPYREKFVLSKMTDYFLKDSPETHINIIFCGGDHYKAYVDDQMIDPGGDGNCLFASILLSNAQCDLTNYPRNLLNDIKNLRNSVCDLLSGPSKDTLEMMLEPLFDADEGTFLDQLEGLPRPLRPLILKGNPSPPILERFNIPSILEKLDILSYSLKHRGYSDFLKDKKKYSKVDEGNPSIDQGRQEFYIFGVGQGNAQLAVYEPSGFAALYDCGSSSQQGHPKYVACQQKLFSSLFVEKVVKREESVSDLLAMMDIDEENLSKFPKTSKLNESQDSIISNKMSIKYKGVPHFIHDLISKYSIHHLFIFLSHPDADHINWINSDAIPLYVNKEILRITAILGGDWLGEGGENTQKTDLSTPVKEVLGFLWKRQCTWTELPYYWNWQGLLKDPYSEETVDTTNHIKFTNAVRVYLEKNKTDAVYEAIKNKTNLQIKNPFNESLYSLILKICADNKSFNPMGLEYHFSRVLESKKDLDKVHVMLMNYPEIKDPNGQSSILIFNMPTLEMNFVCTGDATQDTFSKIKPEQVPDSFHDSRYINLLMLPHHGANDNRSVRMHKLFPAHIYGISAGNGILYGHPSKKLLKDTLFELPTTIDKKFNQTFQLKGKYNNMFLAFKGKNEGAYTANLFENPLYPPILCPNITGTFKFGKDNEDGKTISTLFSSIITTTNGRYFSVLDLSHRADHIEREYNEDLDLVINDGGKIVKNTKTSKLYLEVFSGKSSSFYEVEEVTSDL
jgi:hypothetical protein